MLSTITITDLTQMPTGDRACVAGIDQNNVCVRLFWDDKGFPKDFLFQDGKVIIRPRANITVNLHPVPINPPHIEDMGFDPKSIVLEGLVSESKWEQLLKRSSFNTIFQIYDGLLQANRWVRSGANTRSLGTLANVKVKGVYHERRGFGFRYHLEFSDGKTEHDLPISDLAFRQLCYLKTRVQGISVETVLTDIIKDIKNASRIYLRIGLARPWSSSQTEEQRCWTQVTGIYTFPDYLNGKCFADFESTS